MAFKRAEKTQERSEDLIETVYRKLEETFPDWSIAYGDYIISLRHEGVDPADTVDVDIYFLHNKIEIEVYLYIPTKTAEKYIDLSQLRGMSPEEIADYVVQELKKIV